MGISKKAREFILASLIVIVVGAICFAFSGIIGYRVVAFVLLVTVSFIAMLFDILPVLLSALLSALIWDFFLIPPRFTFYIRSTEDTFTLAMYFVIALINAVLTYKVRQIEKKARVKEEKNNAIQLYNIVLNSLSHELKTPIATIIGATDNLMSGTNKFSAENRQSLLSEISIASVRLNQQVENLLNISRLEAGYIKPKKDWCDVTDLIYSVVNRLEGVEDHVIDIKINEKLPLFKLDIGFMEQVLFNLLRNAITHTDPGTIITISADYTLELNGEILDEISDVKANIGKIKHSLILEISDTGRGFPPDEIEDVFDKFYRLKNSKTGGTGLGLSIVKGLVEAHKGSVSLMNRHEGGAKFILKIPAEISEVNKQQYE